MFLLGENQGTSQGQSHHIAPCCHADISALITAFCRINSKVKRNAVPF